ncbi:PIG-L deacetylase family protein [Kitasatospora sp. SUK 42]|uniref:PIG-L deacetylase family protein n=1 Tax=Kitasatospora sp. SUK 42 TaxID=1588882 RepID=UPI0018CB19A4|nr:PIG-L family deacetylase [Kitasatospora sp. SUK 42]MBV2155381.1 PIG-L family deacetylase [Kitasatospora sp. SUK 42]
MSTRLVVSPHFDDAVLSCGDTLLTRDAATTVLTVCGGSPGPGTPPSEWDWQCGFADGHQAAEHRRQEDERACAAAGAATVHLPFADLPYSGPKDVEEIAAALEPHLAGADEVWAPTGIGVHEDHLATRDAVLLAAQRLAIPRLNLYADNPYAGALGWTTPDGERTGTLRWSDALASMPAGATLGELQLRHLTPARAAAKIALVREHASQLASLGHFQRTLTWLDGLLATEAWFVCTVAAKAVVG